MTRKELIDCIYKDDHDWSCPDSDECPCGEYNPQEALCWNCAEHLLTEYERKIRNQAIDDFVSALANDFEFRHLGYNIRSISDRLKNKGGENF